MIFSDATRLVRVRLGGAHTTTAPTITGDSVVETQDGFLQDLVPIHTVTNGTSNITVLDDTDDLGGGYRRVLKNLAVYNDDTVAATVTVEKYDGTNARIITRATLAADDTLHYEDGRGWYVMDDDGNLKTASGGSSTNVLLDGTIHSDTAAQGVTRGSIVYGNSTPKWDELVIGASGRVLRSDGTDVSYSNIGVPTFLRKSADEIVTSSTTLQNDDHLLQAIAASETWVVEFFLALSNTGTAGFKAAITWPASPTNAMAMGDLPGGGTGSNAGAFTETSGTIVFNSSNAVRVAYLFIYIANGSNAGNIQLQWAQENSNAANTTVEAGSWLRATRIA